MSSSEAYPKRPARAVSDQSVRFIGWLDVIRPMESHRRELSEFSRVGIVGSSTWRSGTSRFEAFRLPGLRVIQKDEPTKVVEVGQRSDD